MRIIAGKFRGRRLSNFKADHIRPTTDRIKESIFNRLQTDIDGARVLDLFSGTGNLTCEAISRGAATVDAVELNRKSIEIIRKNLQLLEIDQLVTVHQKDVLKYLNAYQGEPFDIILIDPPFTEQLADSVLLELGKSEVMGANTVAVIESSSHEFLGEVYEGLEKVAERDYGDKRVTYWKEKNV